jgi:hypothetical protein
LHIIATTKRETVKQVYRITGDSSASEERILSIRIGRNHFGFAISSVDAAVLHNLTWYTGTGIDATSLEDIYRKHPELRDSYQHIFICYDHPESVMVPLHQYKEDDTTRMLQTMFGISGKDAVINEPVSGWQMYNVYAVPRDVFDWVFKQYPLCNYWHCFTLGVRNAVLTDTEGSLAADFRSEDFSLVVTSGNKLLLTQTFPYTTPADFVYYLLDTCRQFNFTQEKVHVYLSGLIDQESALYKELHQYFLNIGFRGADWLVNEAREETYPSHFFTSLNDLAKCAL